LDPSAILHHASPLRIEREGADHVLVLDLPFADKDDLDLGRRDDELLIRVGGHRRSLLLPDTLRSRPVGSATLRDGNLRIVFPGAEGGTDRDRRRRRRPPGAHR
jgi:arsenite-transporting ATPase